MMNEVKDEPLECDVSQQWALRHLGSCLSDVTLVAGLVLVVTSALTWTVAYTLVAASVVKTLRAVSPFRRQVALLLPLFADVSSCLGSVLSNQTPAVILVACLSLGTNCLWCLLYLCRRPADSSGYRTVEGKCEDAGKSSRDKRAAWLVLAISTSLLATAVYVIWRYDITDTWTAPPIEVPEGVGWMWGMTSGALGAVLHWLSHLARLSTQRSLPPGERRVLWGVTLMSLADSWLLAGAWFLLHPLPRLLPALPWLLGRAGYIIINVAYLVCRHIDRPLIPACCSQGQNEIESGQPEVEDDMASWGMWKKRKESLQGREGIFDFGRFVAASAGDAREAGKGRGGKEEWRQQQGTQLASSFASASESLYGALQNCCEWDTEDQSEPESEDDDDDLDIQDFGHVTSYRKVTSPRRPSFNRHLARLRSEAREERVQDWVLSNDHVTARNDVRAPRHSSVIPPTVDIPRRVACEIIPKEDGNVSPRRRNLNSNVHGSLPSETNCTNLLEIHPTSPYDIGQMLAAEHNSSATLFIDDNISPRHTPATMRHDPLAMQHSSRNINRPNAGAADNNVIKSSAAGNYASQSTSQSSSDVPMEPTSRDQLSVPATERPWRKRNLTFEMGDLRRQQQQQQQQRSRRSSRTDTGSTPTSTSATTTSSSSSGEVFYDNNNNDDDVVLSSPGSAMSSPKCWLQWRRPDLSARSVAETSVFQ